MRRALAVLSLIVVCTPSLYAWGEEGHRIVCRIAYLELSEDDQKEVARLTKAYHIPAGARMEQIHSFPDACIFADEARAKAVDAEKAHQTHSPWLHYKPFDNWHFLNVGRDVTTITEEACADDCILVAVTKHAAMLKNGANDQERGEGLYFLGHWLGDIHQPLHISYKNDKGGNDIKPITGGFYTNPNLHSVWDGGIIRKEIAGPGWREFADELQEKITDEQRTQWGSAGTVAWAQESYDISTGEDTLYCKKDNEGCENFGHGRKLTASYQEEFAGKINERLQQAGVRLAALIHEGLSAGGPTGR